MYLKDIGRALEEVSKKFNTFKINFFYLCLRTFVFSVQCKQVMNENRKNTKIKKW